MASHGVKGWCVCLALKGLIKLVCDNIGYRERRAMSPLGNRRCYFQLSGRFPMQNSGCSHCHRLAPLDTQASFSIPASCHPQATLLGIPRGAHPTVTIDGLQG